MSNWSQRLLSPHLHVRLQVGSMLGLGVGFALLALMVTGILGATPARLTDFLYQPAPPLNQVVIVALDDASIQEIGALPWSRATLARLIDALAAGAPRVIGIDLMFPDSADDDALLARALTHAPTIVQPIIGINVSRLTAPARGVPQFHITLAPTIALQTPNTRLGHTLIEPDADGIVRRIPLVIESNGKWFPAFGLAVLSAYTRQPVYSQVEDGWVWLGEPRLPVNEQGFLALNFSSRAPQHTLSAAAVLGGRVAPALLRDKIVLLGVASARQPARYRTPLSDAAPIPAIYLQADLIETLLGNRTLVRQDLLTEIVMVFLIALTAGATIIHTRSLSALALTIIYFLLYVGYAFTKFGQGIIVQPLYPALALILMLIGTLTYRHFSEGRHRAFITRLLRRYLAPEAADLMANGLSTSEPPLRSVRRDVSVLAIDLSELEPLAASLTAEGMVNLLDEYVRLIVGVVFRYEGSVVKQTGSAILAAWNLLIDQPAHAQAAVRAAVEMRHTLADFHVQAPKELTLGIGFGIATGNVIAGQIGASPRAEFTIIGEIVGLAERIAQKPERGVFIDVTTREHMGEDFDMLEVKPVRLRRKTDPAQVWRLVQVSETQTELTPVPLETLESSQ